MCASDTINKPYKDFIKELFQVDGPFQLLVVCVFMSFGFGTLGIAPAITQDSYAKLHYGYTGESCSIDSENGIYNHACELASAEAQKKASFSSFAQYFLLFLTSPLVGSLSDRWGRKGFYMLGIFFSSLGPLFLLLIQIFPSIDPIYYFIFAASPGIANWFGLSFALMADMVPPTLRAISFSLIQICGFAAIALVPAAAAGFGHLSGSILSCGFCVIGFIYAFFRLPETLSEENKQKAIEKRDEDIANGESIFTSIMKPVTEMALLNRNWFFRYVSVVIVMAALIKSGDRAILLFYVQGQLNFTDGDTAIYVTLFSLFGLISQTYVLKNLVQKYGERWTVITGMIFGIFYNLSYGFYSSHLVVFSTTILSGVSSMVFPTTSSMMSFNVLEHEQGSTQGVFTSLNALSSAIGPVMLNSVFDATINGAFMGPGSMFILAAVIYAIGTIFAFLLPKDEANSKKWASQDTLTSLLSDDANIHNTVEGGDFLDLL